MRVMSIVAKQDQDLLTARNMNRTGDFVKLLDAAGPQQAEELSKTSHEDEYAKEAYQILGHINALRDFLINIRPAYLQAAPSRFRIAQNSSLVSSHAGQMMSDKERDEMDFEAKSIIRQVSKRIKTLEAMEEERRSKTKKGGFFDLVFSTVDEREVVLAAHRAAIAWYLNKRLTEASKIQADLQETRLMRAVEKSKSITYAAPVKASPVSPTQPRFEQADLDLSSEQLQMLEEENQALLDGYAQTMTQIRKAEKAVLEIAALQNELVAQLASQEIITEQLYQDAVDSTESVEKGNKQLVRAKRKNKTTTRLVLAFLIMMTLLLLFLDAWY